MRRFTRSSFLTPLRPASRALTTAFLSNFSSTSLERFLKLSLRGLTKNSGLRSFVVLSYDERSENDGG